LQSIFDPGCNINKSNTGSTDFVIDHDDNKETAIELKDETQSSNFRKFRGKKVIDAILFDSKKLGCIYYKRIILIGKKKEQIL
jgi:hypothetical protein